MAKADSSSSPDIDDAETRATSVGSPADGPLKGGKLDKLHYLLQQSSIYSKIIGDKMERDRAERRAAAEKEAKKDAKQDLKPAKPAAPAPTARETRHGNVKAPTTAPVKDKKGKAPAKAKAAAKDVDDDAMEEALAKAPSANGNKRKHEEEGQAEEDHHHTQPSLVTGAALRDYQLAGVEWLITLYENGLNGILADEMGLGKTLQTIAFLAHLREKGVWGPFLIVCPLSTLANWVNEFERFTPSIPVLLYHGNPDERAEMRTGQMGLPSFVKGSKNAKKPRHSAPPKSVKNKAEEFPIIVTTYELVMNDRQYLSRLNWKYIVVDESHRLKNLNCKLIQELKSYTSANRLLLTGTPLHNNLAELWSLLNFILPDIFDSLDSFQQWFDFSDLDTTEGESRFLTEEQSGHVLSNLHAILKPFLLRRIKADVETSLPPKKEYLLSAPLTAQQKELYDAVVNRTIRSFLIDRKTTRDDGASSMATSPAMSRNASVASSEAEMDTDTGSISSRTRKKGTGKKRNYAELSDEQFFDDLENDEGQSQGETEDDSMSLNEMGKAHRKKMAAKSVNSMKLQNLVMQLRKVCNHPWLFDWPVDPDSGANLVNEELINASGKMLLLNRLLDGLFERGHKVLIFSQFTSQLDIIQDWAENLKEWKVARIDGSTKQEDRREQMKSFNEDTSEDAIHLFLLSTRAGGMGVNLTAADTVILFDSDWNPQMDLQAQDRAHRIGQTKPVLVFRLISANTVESTILQRAGAKRKLEALVIGQGTFSKAPAGTSAEDMQEILRGKRSRKEANMSELAEILLRNEGEHVKLAGKDDELLSDEQLRSLLDRSPAAMGRSVGFRQEAVSAAFEVFETQKNDEAGDALARMLREDA